MHLALFSILEELLHYPPHLHWWQQWQNVKVFKLKVFYFDDQGADRQAILYIDRTCLVSGLIHIYHLDETISSYRGFWWMFSFLLYFA